MVSGKENSTTLPLLVGLDIGFGDVKVVFIHSSHLGEMNSFKFPTAVAYARKGVIELDEEAEEYEFEGRRYLVGESTLSSADIFSTRDISFLITYAPLLVYKAFEIIRAKQNENFSEKHVCLGIPLSYFHEKRFELERRVRSFAVNGEFLSFDTAEVRPQSQGILFDFALDEMGNPIMERQGLNLLILDIGFNTVDVLVVVEGRSSGKRSVMFERGGVSKMCEELSQYLQKEYRLNLSEQAVKEILTKQVFKLYGVKKDLSAAIRKMKEHYTDWLVQEVRSRFEDFLKQADKLIIAGGGAYYVRDDFYERYPREFIFIPPEPEYSNARGFLKFLKGVMR